MKTTLCILAVLLIGCGGPQPAPTPVAISCEDICNHYRRLKCPEGNSTADGATCEDVCNNAIEIPAYSARFDCILLALSCDEVRACEQ